jgi:hypothetical protein
MVEAMLNQIATEKGCSNQKAEAYFLKQNCQHIELKRDGTSPEVATATAGTATHPLIH